MKQKILLFLLASFVVFGVSAQKNKKVTAYAITANEKGATNWSEVRLVDITTGEEVEAVYSPDQKPELLNARTGKAITRKTDDVSITSASPLQYRVTRNVDGQQVTLVQATPAAGPAPRTQVCATTKTVDGQTVTVIRRTEVSHARTAYSVSPDAPFATKSAACAYDKKHDRLYYTPMGIDQLRYIDMKSKTPKVFYFEDEPFGVFGKNRDIAKQITRMVFASDGNGYALTNDAHNLIRFTTGKKPEITDLGSITDAPGNAVSIHSSAGYGGDMIADEKKNLYLITANRHVFKISLENQTGTYVGPIMNLPRGFTTNGAIVDEGTTVIVSSAHSTQGYYKFDLNTLQAERISNGGPVFNASDLANGNLVDVKKQKKPREVKEVKDPVQDVVDTKEPAQPEQAVERSRKPEIARAGAIAIYPNPVVTGGVVRVKFTDQPQGKYTMQLLDITGKLISTRSVTITNKVQEEQYRLPEMITSGNYLLKVTNDADQTSVVNKLIVQQ
jgi:hypothetical protein